MPTSACSNSNADFVLVLKLLHWTGDNIALTRRLFLDSGLYREDKTERKTGQTTYLDRVCQVFCVSNFLIMGKPVSKCNGEAIEGRFPVMDGHRPFFGDVLDRQVNDLKDGLKRREKSDDCVSPCVRSY